MKWIPRFILAVALVMVAWVSLTAWATVQPLGPADFPALEKVLEQHGISGKPVAGMVFQANREVWVAGTVQMEEGPRRDFLIRLGHLDERPVLNLNK